MNVFRIGGAAAIFLLAACDGDASAIKIETAWCDVPSDSDVMARLLRGELESPSLADAQAHCVLVPPGTAISVVEETENNFRQSFLKAELVRPDTGEKAELWVRKDAAGIE